MNAEIIKEFETPDEKAIMDKLVKDYIARETVKNEKIKNIISNPDYIKWLHKFTLDKDIFYDNEWRYCSKQISNLDRENVEKLSLLYEGIDKYAKLNYICPTPCKFGHFYNIRFNNLGFEIGVVVGQGTEFFCKKVIAENDFIDFNDIMINKKQDNVEMIKSSLESLSNMVLSAYEKGVPIEFISSTLDIILLQINSMEDNKSRILKK